ncbi:MAG: MBL fold metallo-hydrolase [Myxococcales bacterium]|nr:MBL fold metallo-hydrolase [Myxococcales bacterium]
MTSRRHHLRSACALGLLALAACERSKAPRTEPAGHSRGEAPLPRAESAPAALATAGEQHASGDGNLHVYFFDVGQGDAALVVSPSGRTVLIDGGPEGAGSYLAHRLPELVKGQIDLVVLTVAHPEHAGGLFQAIRAVGTKRFLHGGQAAADPVTEALLGQLRRRGTPIAQPAPDPAAPAQMVAIGLGGAELAILWPRAPAEAHLSAGARSAEANSVVMRVSHGETSVLLAADAQAETEEYLLGKRLEFRSTLLKVASHGAAMASTADFLAAVQPKAAVLSVGAGNAAGLPARRVVDDLEAQGARVFRTDLDGELHAVSDGQSFALSTERPAAGEAPGTVHRFAGARADAGAAFVPARKPQPPAARRDAKSKPAADGKKDKPGEARPPAQKGESGYVASKNSEVFHLPGCRAAKRIAEKNLLTFRTREEAARERRPAKDCNP